ncbi:Uncharacterised protein [Bacillus freudenreichii]|nr:Uncharacterised protein [Bacillus freudenreichii]
MVKTGPYLVHAFGFKLSINHTSFRVIFLSYFKKGNTFGGMIRELFTNGLHLGEKNSEKRENIEEARYKELS